MDEVAEFVVNDEDCGGGSDGDDRCYDLGIDCLPRITWPTTGECCGGDGDYVVAGEWREAIFGISTMAVC